MYHLLEAGPFRRIAVATERDIFTLRFQCSAFYSLIQLKTRNSCVPSHELSHRSRSLAPRHLLTLQEIIFCNPHRFLPQVTHFTDIKLPHLRG